MFRAAIATMAQRPFGCGNLSTTPKTFDGQQVNAVRASRETLRRWFVGVHPLRGTADFFRPQKVVNVSNCPAPTASTSRSFSAQRAFVLQTAALRGIASGAACPSSKRSKATSAETVLSASLTSPQCGTIVTLTDDECKPIAEMRLEDKPRACVDALWSDERARPTRRGLSATPRDGRWSRIRVHAAPFPSNVLLGPWTHFIDEGPRFLSLSPLVDIPVMISSLPNSFPRSLTLILFCTYLHHDHAYPYPVILYDVSYVFHRSLYILTHAIFFPSDRLRTFFLDFTSIFPSQTLPLVALQLLDLPFLLYISAFLAITYALKTSFTVAHNSANLFLKLHFLSFYKDWRRGASANLPLRSIEDVTEGDPLSGAFHTDIPRILIPYITSKLRGRHPTRYATHHYGPPESAAAEGRVVLSGNPSLVYTTRKARRMEIQLATSSHTPVDIVHARLFHHQECSRLVP
ncbi:hypothetical protein NMY22_g18617 [Coprinellus aureogranulatus]|nr:hypothetical protein NMY22_g18617 [Coprinellus aureogranulatus]